MKGYTICYTPHPNPSVTASEQVAVVVIPFAPHEMALELVYQGKWGFREPNPRPTDQGRVAAVFRGTGPVVRKLKPKPTKLRTVKAQASG